MYKSFVKRQKNNEFSIFFENNLLEKSRLPRYFYSIVGRPASEGKRPHHSEKLRLYIQQERG